MKLRNKKTGEIGYTAVLRSKAIVVMDENAIQLGSYTSLAELNEEWEDYEELKEWWYIDIEGKVKIGEWNVPNHLIEFMKQIGNYFETKEEAELAVRKFKAWKRLKDKGFRFTLTPGVGSLDITPGKFQIEITADMPAKWFCCDAVQKDLEVCFGGEE